MSKKFEVDEVWVFDSESGDAVQEKLAGMMRLGRQPKELKLGDSPEGGLGDDLSPPMGRFPMGYGQ